jgi:hypothetical protein
MSMMPAKAMAPCRDIAGSITREHHDRHAQAATLPSVQQHASDAYMNGGNLQQHWACHVPCNTNSTSTGRLDQQHQQQQMALHLQASPDSSCCTQRAASS